MDPHNGEILAMASWPTFNPNSYNDSKEDARRNRAVQDLYEPGSTFKLVTASAAFEERVVKPDEMIDVSAGIDQVPGPQADQRHAHYGMLSFTDVIVKSSNVGAIKIGLEARAASAWASTSAASASAGRSSPDFPGESPGIVWDSAKLNDSALASVSMGYQVGVTPLQMAAAVSAVANGGTLYEPHVVRAVIKGDVRTRGDAESRAARDSSRNRRDAHDHHGAVVQRRHRQARADGRAITVAGKTGTADKLVNGRYSPSQQNVSFVGFVPSRSPVLTMIVMIDSPRVGRRHRRRRSPRRSSSGSPMPALRQLGIAPTINPAPPVIVARRRSTSVTDHRAPGSIAGPSVGRRSAGAGDAADGGALPDLRGLGARDALRELARLGLTARIARRRAS